jgi:hypothetical protein
VGLALSQHAGLGACWRKLSYYGYRVGSKG